MIWIIYDRKNCMEIIAANFDHCKNNPAFESNYIKVDTLKQIMALVDTDTLKSLTNDEKLVFPKTYVEREVSYRKIAFMDEIRYLMTEQLIALQDQTVLFPDVLDEELSKRRDVVPTVHMDPDRCSKHITLDDNFLCARLDRKNRYALVHATKSRRYDEWGKWYFEVRIEKMDELYGSSISIGWDMPRKSYNDIPNLSFGWQNNGVLYYGEKMDYIEERYGSGDVVGCLIDQDRQTVSWFRNGERVILFRKLSNSKLNEIPHVPIDNIVYELYPAAAMFKTRDSAQCCICFRFTEPFSHGIPLPYTAAYATENKQNPE